MMSRWALLLLSLAGCLALVACGGGGGNPFGFEIPADVETLEEAVDFVRVKENAKPPDLEKVGLVDNREVSISFFAVTFPERKPPDVLVVVKSPRTVERFESVRAKWARNLRHLFDRWDICDLDIAWVPSHDLRLSDADIRKTPGCP